MKKNFSLLSGMFLISVLFVMLFFIGNAPAAQCEPCNSMAVEKAISEKEKFQLVGVASIPLSNHADFFKTFLASNLPEITKKQTPTALGRTAYLIKPYVLSGAEMKWIQVMNLSVRKSQNTHCPCPWENDPQRQMAFRF